MAWCGHVFVYVWYLTSVFPFCTTGLASGLVGQVAAALELKMEKQDKDDMNDNLSIDGKSDDESDKRDMKTPRTGTRTR